MNWKTCFLPLLLAAAVLGSVTAFADGEPAAPPAVQNEAQTALAPGNTITKGNLTYTVNDDGQTVTLANGRSATGAITIPDAIEKGEESYPVTRVGGKAFENCLQLVSVTFSGNIDSIGDIAFAHCLQLVSVTFSGNIDSIGVDAFSHCWQLVSVTFSGKVDSIGISAFQDCDTLKTVTFSGDVGSIWDFAFYSCDALKTLTFSGSVDSIGYSAFFGCDALENVTFSGNVRSIGNETFGSCDALESVTFSGDVGSIGNNAFYNCTALTTIYVPTSMPEETVQIIRDALNSSGLPGVKIEKFEPEQPSDPATDPSTPSVPSTGTPSTPSTGTTSTGSAVQQLEAAERPDPMDVEANERYNFWMDVKSDLRAAGDGRTVRVYVPADYTNMPASVMETIRTLGKEITIDLRWNGQRLIITPQTALQRPARKAFWTFDALCEVYAR